MRFKKGVKIFGVRNELTLAMIIANEVYRNHGYGCTITSGVEGTHSKASLHYSGCAFDTRTRDIEDWIVSSIYSDIKDSLNDEYDVILESDHIHIEFQPKR